jgi:hypothetical protein
MLLSMKRFIEFLVDSIAKVAKNQWSGCNHEHRDVGRACFDQTIPALRGTHRAIEQHT